MTDEKDFGTPTDIVFDNQHNERKPWTILGEDCSRSFISFAFQCIVILILVITSVVRIILADTCEETALWASILSVCVGYVLPQPRP